VNTCQRVESLTRQLDAGILITEQVYREVRGLIRVRAFDPVSVKGKREPLRIFEVLDAKGESDD
jgi:adenylate cyclase